MARIVAAGVALLTVVALTQTASIGGKKMADSRSPIASVADKIIHISALVAVPPDSAFAYFASPALLRQWLTPAADVEARVGGRYELFWEPDDRENNSTIGCRITAFAASQLLAFQWRSPKQFKSFANTADPLTHVVVAFLPEGPGTRIHLIHSGWRSTPEWEEARAWQEKAWLGAFEELKRVAKE